MFHQKQIQGGQIGAQILILGLTLETPSFFPKFKAEIACIRITQIKRVSFSEIAAHCMQVTFVKIRVYTKKKIILIYQEVKKQTLLVFRRFC